MISRRHLLPPRKMWCLESLSCSGRHIFKRAFILLPLLTLGTATHLAF